ncbi:cytochrome C oxidase subunit II [Cohnella silvisoli]|uniref:Cytochrome c oxidase subunit II n=1 Tax=Cohnella silvisoli TaxID=2873699 RepID=A0ABV1KXM3_9BACL|nr:cytochrome C oxidase subunit II [Cohnella silvisoli]MCD9024208.1 cytochrome C oxidase subunit II [Cohnella silvisoli]
MYKKLAFFLTATALLLALSACGSSNKDSNSGNSSPSADAPSESASEELVITATSWEFDKSEYTIPKDTPVKLTLENTKGAHGIEIIGQDISIRGNKSEIVKLPAGTYEIKCNIMCGNGHTQMKAKLIVS